MLTKKYIFSIYRVRKTNAIIYLYFFQSNLLWERLKDASCILYFFVPSLIIRKKENVLFQEQSRHRKPTTYEKNKTASTKERCNCVRTMSGNIFELFLSSSLCISILHPSKQCDRRSSSKHHRLIATIVKICFSLFVSVKSCPNDL